MLDELTANEEVCIVEILNYPQICVYILSQAHDHEAQISSTEPSIESRMLQNMSNYYCYPGKAGGGVLKLAK